MGLFGCAAKRFILALMLVYASTSECKNAMEKKNAGSCILDGEVYQNQQEFYSRDCAMSCFCHHSKLTCRTSCPLEVGRCPPQHKVEFFKTALKAAPSCFCLEKRGCIRGGLNTENKYSLSYMQSSTEHIETISQYGESNPCYVDGKVYQPGEKYITKDCRAMCICHSRFASCTPLCQRKQLICPDGFKISSILQPAIEGSSCSCDTPTCLQD